jgi:sugar (pentulose or hexulose) kinase
MHFLVFSPRDGEQMLEGKLLNHQFLVFHLLFSTIVGITDATTKAHIARAVVESVAFSSKEVKI